MNSIFKNLIMCCIIIISFNNIYSTQESYPHKDKKFLIISDINQNRIGGTEKVIKEIKTRLEKKGLNVFVLDFSQVSTFTIPGMSDEKSVYPWRIRKELESLIQDFNPDYILIIPLGIMSFVAGNYCYKKKIPFSVFCSVRMPQLCKSLLHIPTKITTYFMNKFLSKASIIFVPTQSFADELYAQNLQNIVVWPHGVDTEFFKLPNQAQKEEARIKCNLENCQRPIYLFVGRLTKIKNLEAFLDLNIPGTKVVVGNENVGYSLKSLQAKYPQAIFPGPKIGQELLDYYASADIFIFPSKIDAFGLVILEALASGLPLVAFDVCGPRDIAPTGCNVSYLAHDNAQLQQCASQAWSDLSNGYITPEQCNTYAQKFSWDDAVNSLVQNAVQIQDKNQLSSQQIQTSHAGFINTVLKGATALRLQFANIVNKFFKK